MERPATNPADAAFQEGRSFPRICLFSAVYYVEIDACTGAILKSTSPLLNTEAMDEKYNMPVTSKEGLFTLVPLMYISNSDRFEDQEPVVTILHSEVWCMQTAYHYYGQHPINSTKQKRAHTKSPVVISFYIQAIS